MTPMKISSGDSREIERQNTRHQRGTHVGPQHDHQCRRERHQILCHKGGDKQGGGITALNQRRDAYPRTKGERLLLNAAAENGA